MKIENFEIDDDERVEQRPFIRMSTGEGCDLPGCHCSDGYWISLSDGRVGLMAEFTNKCEMETFLKHTHSLVA